MFSTRGAQVLVAAALVLLACGCTATLNRSVPTQPNNATPTPTHHPNDGLPWITPIDFDDAEAVAHPGYWEPVGVIDSSGATRFQSLHIQGCTLAVNASPASVIEGAIQAGADRASTVIVIAKLTGYDIADVKGDWKLSTIRYGNDPEHIGRVDVLETNGTDKDGAYRSVARVLTDVDLFIRFHIECADQSALQTATGPDNASIAIATS
ncbi:hypothetical protein ACPPVW_06605 [Leifsonia sp. McL0607]|uniref:hypothetical protein n=1 Tax=Leifsonia sp. McL0607 TaxID=3415672 RepID=UPI003CF7C3B0